MSCKKVEASELDSNTLRRGSVWVYPLLANDRYG
jgi:hypothetical protein